MGSTACPPAQKKLRSSLSLIPPSASRTEVRDGIAQHQESSVRTGRRSAGHQVNRPPVRRSQQPHDRRGGDRQQTNRGRSASNTADHRWQCAPAAAASPLRHRHHTPRITAGRQHVDDRDDPHQCDALLPQRRRLLQPRRSITGTRNVELTPKQNYLNHQCTIMDCEDFRMRCAPLLVRERALARSLCVTVYSVCVCF